VEALGGRFASRLRRATGISGIATSFHQRGHQVIAFCDCPFGGIDKARLYGFPPFQKAFVFHWIKIANVELFNPLLAIG
jgi:hypothetical protein